MRHRKSIFLPFFQRLLREKYLAKKKSEGEEHLRQKPLAPCHWMPVKDKMLPASALARVLSTQRAKAG